MTREEAIAILIREIDEDPFMRTEHRELIHGALNMAIKALEQEPCDDCVRRQDVEDAIAEMTVNGESLGYAVAYDILSDLPPVTPRPKMGRWIDDKCSVCGKGTEDLISSSEWYRNEEPKYCPFCGTKLESEEKE